MTKEEKELLLKDLCASMKPYFDKQTIKQDENN